MNYNRVIMTGRITADPELKIAHDKEYIGFQIAVEKYKNTGADFFKVSAFGQTANFVSEYVKQGDLLLVEGRLTNNNWTDKEGVKKYSVEIIANMVKLMRKKNKANDDKQEEKTEEIVRSDDEIPF